MEPKVRSSFIVRAEPLSAEPANSRRRWRGEVHCVATGERRFFREIESMLVYLRRRLAARGRFNIGDEEPKERRQAAKDRTGRETF